MKLEDYHKIVAAGGADKKPSKRKNRWCEYEGIKFQSEGERNRYIDLQRLQRFGQIRDLRLQRRFPLSTVAPAGKRVTIAHYTADFTYEERQKDGTWLFVVEDYKGMVDRMYALKRKWMLLEHGITIRETGARRKADGRRNTIGLPNKS